MAPDLVHNAGQAVGLNAVSKYNFMLAGVYSKAILDVPNIIATVVLKAMP
jgi:hypothetical protein